MQSSSSKIRIAPSSEEPSRHVYEQLEAWKSDRDDRTGYAALPGASQLSSERISSGEREPLDSGEARTMSASASEEASKLKEAELQDLKEREEELKALLEDSMTAANRRAAPLHAELTANRQKQLQVSISSGEWGDNQAYQGPESLKWVDSLWFTLVCTMVICINGAFMVISFVGLIGSSQKRFFAMADQAFLVFYTIELTLKALLFRRDLLIGKVAIVWWNWLDMLIVVSGIIDQWIVPWVAILCGGRMPGMLHQVISHLRLLRLFRIFRLLKVIKIFLRMDLRWVEDQPFQMFMLSVIAFNALVLGMELDIKWAGWSFIETFLLVTYTFEISVRLKHEGVRFFYNENYAWNNLDFSIVASGIADGWCVPLLNLIVAHFTNKPMELGKDTSFGAIMNLLRLMRLLRVLRLIRLLRSIAPLYKLVTGIVEAAQGVQWVLLLTLVLLYAAAIVFTSLIGKGLLYGGEDVQPDSAKKNFGSVTESMFMLFKLMNDDQSVVEGVIDNAVVELMFAVFMIISNWMVLAVLTSVVSDGMVYNTQKTQEAEKALALTNSRERSIRRLMALFKEATDPETSRASFNPGIDHSQERCRAMSGIASTDSCSYHGEGDDRWTITQSQFDEIITDAVYRDELMDASGLDQLRLEEMFHICSTKNPNDERTIDYVEFIYQLQRQSQPVTERAIMRLENNQRSIERRLDQILDLIVRSNHVDDSTLEQALRVGSSITEKSEKGSFKDKDFEKRLAHDALFERSGHSPQKNTSAAAAAASDSVES